MGTFVNFLDGRRHVAKKSGMQQLVTVTACWQLLDVLFGLLGVLSWDGSQGSDSEG